MHQQPQESIWGTINSCVEIALNIYMIIAVDEQGVEHSGIMAHQDAEGKILSEKAADLAVKDGEWLHFDEHVKDVALFEVLEKRLESCKKIEAAVLREMEEIKKGTQILLPQYFGDCQPPEVGSDSVAEPIRNGLYWMKHGAESVLAVHESITEQYLTPMAMGFGQPEGEYRLFSLAHCAIPFYELKDMFPEVESQIVSMESLYATLHEQFGEYVKAFDALVPAKQQIPVAEAPVSLFLPLQLELSREEDAAEDFSDGYGESVDFGIEP